MKYLLLIIAMLSLPSCVPPPPTLTPDAQWAFTETRIIKGLDTLRDVVVLANHQTPPVVSTAFMLNVTRTHRAALVTIHAHPLGWQKTVTTALDQLVQSVPPKEAAIVQPYITLADTIIKEIP